MKTARISEYRSKLSTYHNRVLTDHEPLRIVGPARGDVIVLSVEDYERLRNSIAVLKDRATMNSLLEGRADFADAAHDKSAGMKDVFNDVMDSENKQTGADGS